MELSLARAPLRDKKSAVMRRSSVSLFLRFTALVCVVAWFVASNHCALAALIDRMVKNSAVVQCKHCPTKDSSTGKHGAPMSACCKGIKATVPKGASVVFIFAIASSPFAVIAVPIQPPPRTRGEVFAAIGPPRAASFAEAVLSRCFQSHAPPFAG
ncbi:MAG TPA: hypothetical protein VEO95_09760 [Chthoniobacteraceae bacterium]|nr:hypothetical protein [Chthoniobacteraceae bacterium]